MPCIYSEHFKPYNVTLDPMPRSEMSDALKTVIGESFVDQEMKEVTFKDRVQEMKLIGLYFSAQWCPPCRGFTPKLAKAHEKWKEQGHEVEIIYVSADQDEQMMTSYLKEDHGKWLALPFGDSKIEELGKKYSVNGIPTLIVLNADGGMIDKSARKTLMRKGAKAIDLWMKGPVEDDKEGEQGEQCKSSKTSKASSRKNCKSSRCIVQ